MRAWLATLVATVVSTYALDAVATAAGLLLTASGLLGDLGHAPLLVFLAATYLVWGAGLRANLQANWSLLCRTGASTNALSKAAFDLARRRGTRAQRLAAGAGYVATELAKEAPYYAGAFGAVLVTSSVSANDALIFLGGANLGAAAYEFGLAGITRQLLRRRPYASFDSDWVPREYLADYYRVVEPDERETIAFFVDAIRRAPAGEPVLVLGTGPTLHHVRAFVRYTLECEGLDAPTGDEIARREELTRSSITRLLQVDARRPISVDRQYGTVISAYCADSATHDRIAWENLMGNIAGPVRPGGLFITAALRRCNAYVVGYKRFPSANVDERDVRRVLEPRFRSAIEVRHLAGHAAQGYSSIVLGWATLLDPEGAVEERGGPPLVLGGVSA
jgi:NNMT/PNMT/TEMT family